MAEFRQRKRNVSRTGLVFKKEKRKGLSEAKTELIMAQLREMYPDQFVNKYPINKSKDEWAPMISVLGENLELFEKRRKEEYLETDMSQFIPPTTEKIIAPLLSGNSNRYYTIFGEGRTELLLRGPEALIDISWKQTYPAEGFDEVFRLNIMEGGKSVNLTLSPFESRLQRTEVRGIIERIKKTRPVEYSLRQNDAYGIVNSIEKMSGSKVMVSYNPTDQTLSFSGGEESISVSTSANARGKHRVSESMGIYSKKEILNVFRSSLFSVPLEDLTLCNASRSSASCFPSLTILRSSSLASAYLFFFVSLTTVWTLRLSCLSFLTALLLFLNSAIIHTPPLLFNNLR